MTRGIKLSQAEINERNRQFELGRHWCYKCKQFRSVDEFAKNKSGAYGLNGKCRDCHKKTRDHAGQRKYLNKRNRKLAYYFAQEGGGCCQKCGYNDSVAALDFHHINPDEKEYNPAYTVVSGNLELARYELDKCILICSNCHREYGAGLWRAEYVKRDGLGWTIKKGSIVTTSFDDADQLPDRYRYTQLGLRI